MMHTPNRKTAATEPRTDRNSLTDALSGEAGVAARARKLAQLDAVSARIQAQRNAGTSRQGFVALEHLSEAVAAARETIEALAKA